MNITDLFTPSIETAHSVATLAVNILVQSSLIIVAGLLATRLLRSHGAAVQSTVLRVTLIAVVACPLASRLLATAGVSGFAVELPIARVESAQAIPKVHALSIADSSEIEVSPDRFTDDEAIIEIAEVPMMRDSRTAPLDSYESSYQPSQLSSSAPEHLLETPRSEAEPARARIASVPLMASIYGTAGMAWSLIAIMLLGRLAVANLFVWRGRSRAKTADVDAISACGRLARTIGVETPAIRVSSRIQSPCLVGVIHPTILLPAAMKSVSRDVLVHELAHLRRQDCLWQLLSCLASAALWFQPLSWLLSRRLEQTADDVADDFVVQFGNDRAEYARQLVDIAQRYQPEWSGACVGAGIVSLKSSLAKRVLRILDTSRSLSTRTGLAALVAIILLGATCTLAVGLLGAGTVQAESAAADDSSNESGRNRPQEAPARDAASEEPEQVRCSGQVLDPDGKPVAGAKLYLAYYSKEPVKARVRATSNTDGRFEFKLDRKSLGNSSADAQIVAVAKGYGLDWQKPFDQQGQLRDVALRLVPDAPIEGRIIDIEGNPVAEATVQVPFIRTTPDENLDDLLQAWERESEVRLRITARDQLVTKQLMLPDISSLQAAKTDADGRFRLAGFGKDRWLNLTVTGPRIGSTFITVLARPRDEIEPLVKGGSFTPTYGTEFEHAAAPGRDIIGIVREKGTGKPLAGAYVYGRGVEARTDEDGRYRLERLGKAEKYWVGARTDSHFSAGLNTPDTPGLDPITVDLELEKGIALHIRLRDKSTGQPVRGQFAYYGAIGNKNVEGTAFASQPYVGTRGSTNPDGSGTMVVFPGPGYLGVRGQENRFVPVYPGDAKEARPFHQIKAIPNAFGVGLFHTVLEINPQEGKPETCELEIELDPGGTRGGRVTGPDGKRLDNVLFAGKAAIRPWAGPGYETLASPDFEVVGLIPDLPRTVLFMQRENKLAKAIDVIADDAPLAVTLEPMGAIAGQVIDADGKPRTDATVRLQIHGHTAMGGRGLPIPPLGSLAHTLWGDNEMRGQVLQPTTKVDDEGLFRFDGLVSGLTYDFYAHVGAEFGVLHTDVAAQPGKTIDVGPRRIQPIKRVPKESSSRLRTDATLTTTVGRGTAATQTPGRDSSARKEDSTNRRTLAGCILDATGKPASGAFIAILAYNVQPKPGATDLSAWAEVLAEATTADGKFELQLGDVTSKTHIYPSLLARTQDSGLAWRRLDFDVSETDIELTLQPQELLEGRLVDIDGRPVAQLPIELSGIMTPADDSPSRNELGLPGLDQPPKAWLPPIKTDDRGNFTIRNVTLGHGLRLKIPGTEQVATQDLSLNTGMREQRGENDRTYRPLVKNVKLGERATMALAPAQIFEGVVLLGDSGKPAANARITMWASQQEDVGSMVSIEGKTDANGRFRLNPNPGVRFGIVAYPPKGSPYQLKRLNDLRWDSGSGPKSIEMRLAKGVLARGWVVDAKTGKPLKGASVQYHPDRANNKNLTSDIVTGWQGIQKTNDDGEFEIAVLPGPGTLLVHAANGSNYVLQEMGWREIDEGKPGGPRNYAHAFRKIDSAAGEEIEPMKMKLQPGVSVSGTLADQTGNPIESALVVSRLKIADHSPQWRGFSEEALNGKFEISGLRDGEDYPVYFLDAKNKLGAVATISTKSPSPKIVLKPCGSAKARFVDLEGKPVESGLQLGLYMVVTPGKPKYDFQAYRNGETQADEDFVANIDRVNYRRARKTDENGEMTFPALIPGVQYRFVSFTEGGAISTDFIAKSGEAYDMGDIEVQLNR
jgi:beta-lactamase regulating signal transducer with metallopeptidase domain